jgi:SHS2 domain-containing protein
MRIVWRSAFEDTVGHEFIDHTSEITLRVEGPTFAALIGEATQAMAELACGSLEDTAATESRDFHVQAPDQAAALVEWLNEIVYLSESEQWLPVEVDVEDQGAEGLRIRASGVQLSEPWVLVKAATLHQASVVEAAGRLVAEVTLDV